MATDGVGLWWYARCRLLVSFDVQFAAITGPGAMVVARLDVDQRLMPVLLQEAGRSIGIPAKCAGGTYNCRVERAGHRLAYRDPLPPGEGEGSWLAAETERRGHSMWWQCREAAAG